MPVTETLKVYERRVVVGTKVFPIPYMKQSPKGCSSRWC